MTPEAGMDSELAFTISPQPDPTTCGPTCLHAIYRYFGDDISLADVIKETFQWEDGGGTVDVFLANHALRRGYKATLYTCNVQMFDPTWFTREGVDIAERLRAQAAVKKKKRLQIATQGYLEFLSLGGKLRFSELTPGLIRQYLRRSIPILTGLSATYLYNDPRELPSGQPDDILGKPVGHFVVLYGYRPEEREVLIADPDVPNSIAEGHYYAERIERVISAILLGILTYDANLLILEPPKPRPTPSALKKVSHEHTGGGQ